MGLLLCYLRYEVPPHLDLYVVSLTNMRHPWGQSTDHFAKKYNYPNITSRQTGGTNVGYKHHAAERKILDFDTTEPTAAPTTIKNHFFFSFRLPSPPQNHGERSKLLTCICQNLSASSSNRGKFDPVDNGAPVLVKAFSHMIPSQLVPPKQISIPISRLPVIPPRQNAIISSLAVMTNAIAILSISQWRISLIA
jgi:hypothetical protein